MMPKITPREWKEQMREQEVENDLSKEEKAIADKAVKMIVDEYGEVIKKL